MLVKVDVDVTVVEVDVEDDVQDDADDCGGVELGGDKYDGGEDGE